MSLDVVAKEIGQYPRKNHKCCSKFLFSRFHIQFRNSLNINCQTVVWVVQHEAMPCSTEARLSRAHRAKVATVSSQAKLLAARPTPLLGMKFLAPDWNTHQEVPHQLWNLLFWRAVTLATGQSTACAIGERLTSGPHLTRIQWSLWVQ